MTTTTLGIVVSRAVGLTLIIISLASLIDLVTLHIEASASMNESGWSSYSDSTEIEDSNPEDNSYSTGVHSTFLAIPYFGALTKCTIGFLLLFFSRCVGGLLARGLTGKEETGNPE